MSYRRLERLPSEIASHLPCCCAGHGTVAVSQDSNGRGVRFKRHADGLPARCKLHKGTHNLTIASLGDTLAPVRLSHAKRAHKQRQWCTPKRVPLLSPAGGTACAHRPVREVCQQCMFLSTLHGRAFGSERPALEARWASKRARSARLGHEAIVHTRMFGSAELGMHTDSRLPLWLHRACAMQQACVARHALARLPELQTGARDAACKLNNTSSRMRHAACLLAQSRMGASSQNGSLHDRSMCINCAGQNLQAAACTL